MADVDRRLCKTGYELYKLLYTNMLRLRGGLLLRAHRLLYRKTLGLEVIKEKKQLYPHPNNEQSAHTPFKRAFTTHPGAASSRLGALLRVQRVGVRKGGAVSDLLKVMHT